MVEDDVPLVNIFGLKVVDLNQDDFYNYVTSEYLDGVRYCVTPNIDHFMRYCSAGDDDFVVAYNSADYRVCDSKIAKRILYGFKGLPVNVVTGSDLTAEFFRRNVNSGKVLCIIGSSNSDIELIKKKYPGLILKGYSPSYGFLQNESEIKKIYDYIYSAGVIDYMFLALGSPQQEVLARKIKIEFGSKKNFLIFCVDASVDFLIGRQLRAPYLFRLMYLEWLFRLFSNPRRLIRRYFSNFIWLLRNIGNI